MNTELIVEMQQEMDKGNYIDAKAISNDIRENEQKIMQHGKRADTIIKGLLQQASRKEYRIKYINLSLQRRRRDRDRIRIIVKLRYSKGTDGETKMDTKEGEPAGLLFNCQ